MKKRPRSRSPTKLRYVAEAAYPRGNLTRARLIAAAIRLFGQHGFEAASTRDIAAAASLNTPALQYYFNNKEGLYAACAEHIVSQAWDVMKDVVVPAERLLAASADDDALIEAFCAIQNRLADFLNGASGDWLLWLAREQSAPGSASAFLLDHRHSQRMMQAGRAIVARLLGRPIRDAESIVQEMSLNGQLVRFYLMRDRALKILGWADIDADGLALIKRVVRQNSVAALRLMVAQRKRTAAEPDRTGTRRVKAAAKRRRATV
jgi:AcrR family transcriptional regulator